MKQHIIIPSVTIVTGENDQFALIEDPGFVVTTCTLPAGTYYLRGDGAADDLAKAIHDAIEAASNNGASYSYSVTWRSATAFVSTTLSLELTSGANSFDLAFLGSGAGRTFDGGHIGFPVTSSFDSVLDSSYQPRGVWTPTSASERLDERPRAMGSQFRSVSGKTYTHDRSGTEWTDLVLTWPWMQEEIVETRNRNTENRPLYECWAEWRKGNPVEMHELEPSGVLYATPPESTTLQGTYVLDETHLEEYVATRHSPGVPFYTSPPTLWRQYVA